MPISQVGREMGVNTPLGDDVLVLYRMTATEELGRLSEFDLELLSEDAEVDLDAVLVESMTVWIELDDGSMRYFNGIVSRFSHVGEHGRLTLYQATLRPWLWLLTLTADCRIFQQMTVPDIVKEVLSEHGFSDVEDMLSGSYRTWDYCVQYRETDFNFVSRLMEQEGICYFFTHEDGKHNLVLADGPTSHSTMPNYEEVPFFPPDEMDRRERDHIFEWSFAREVQPGTVALNDFDFTAPKKRLRSQTDIVREHARAEFEIYDYPGEYKEKGDGDAYSTVRIEELQAGHERADATGNARGLCVGSLFTLTDFPREDQNREYLIVSTLR